MYMYILWLTRCRKIQSSPDLSGFAVGVIP